MNLYQYQIQPKNYCFDASQIEIMVDVQLNTKCRVIYNIHTEDRKYRLAFGELTMEGADYDAWGVDDNYIIEWTCNKLGLTLKK